MPYYKECPLVGVDLCSSQSSMNKGGLKNHIVRKHADLWLPDGQTTVNIHSMVGNEHEFVVAEGNFYFLVTISRNNFDTAPLKFVAMLLTNCNKTFRCRFSFGKLEYDASTSDTEIDVSFLCSEEEWQHPPLLPVQALTHLTTNGEIHLTITVEEEEC